ncbi:hypothetical protein D3C87_1181890 [compost metagenome]
MRTLSALTSMIKTNKTGPLFKVLTVLFVVFLQVGTARAEMAFDFVSLAELNQEAAVTWNSLVKTKGVARTEQALRENPPTEVQMLGQQLTQFLQTSQVEFEALKQMGLSGKIENLMGAKMHPLLRHMLINSVMLDLHQVVVLTKPGIFSFNNHAARVAKVYYYAFPSKQIHGGQLFPVTKEQMEDLPDLPDLPKLMVLARTSALAALLLQVSESKNCSQIVDLAWALQARAQVMATSVGFSSTSLLRNADGLAMNEFVDCFRKNLETKMKSTEMSDWQNLDPYATGAGGQKYSEKQLMQMAAGLLGQDL